MHQMLEQMFEGAVRVLGCENAATLSQSALSLALRGGRGALADHYGTLDEHRQLAEKHLMSRGSRLEWQRTAD